MAMQFEEGGLVPLQSGLKLHSKTSGLQMTPLRVSWATTCVGDMVRQMTLERPALFAHQLQQDHFLAVRDIPGIRRRERVLTVCLQSNDSTRKPSAT